MFNQFRYLLLIYIVFTGSLNTIAQVAMPDNVCVGASKHYNVDVNPVSGSTYRWRIDGIIQSSSVTNEINITWTVAGTYLLDVQEISADGCLGLIRSGQVFVSSVPVIIANANSPVCVGSPINLTSQSASGFTYLWSGPNGYLSSLQNPVIYSAALNDAGIYSLTVSSNGCSSAPSYVSIIVNNCVLDFFIPEGFSPNGDGINDLFVIRGIDNYPMNKIIIYNRWGNKVFDASPYINTWDGKSTYGIKVSGDVLPIGTYFYLLDLGTGIEIIKGFIYLNK
jgi:gliding motility-associated-like protein